ncbi:MAG: hypothetical protein AAF570_19865 [Bacteroidota bacterium]
MSTSTNGSSSDFVNVIENARPVLAKHPFLHLGGFGTAGLYVSAARLHHSKTDVTLYTVSGKYTEKDGGYTFTFKGHVANSTETTIKGTLNLPNGVDKDGTCSYQYQDAKGNWILEDNQLTSPGKLMKS